MPNYVTVVRIGLAKVFWRAIDADDSNPARSLGTKSGSPWSRPVDLTSQRGADLFRQRSASPNAAPEKLPFQLIDNSNDKMNENKHA